MKMKLFLSSIFAVLFAVGFCGHAGEQVKLKPSGTTFAADAVKPFVDSGELPGIITIFSKGDVAEISCIGWADVDKKIPIAMDQMFMQCSQTKGFCGVTIAMLVEEGKISLEDPITKYLPEFAKMEVVTKEENGKTVITPAKTVPTIRMVMNHTAGFPSEIPTKSKKGWPALSLRDTAREAASKQLLFEPGTKVQYSNTGIDIGAAIVEVVTGKPWDVFLKERVLDPLGMKDTTFNPTDAQLAHVISLYKVKPGEKAKWLRAAAAMPLPHNGPTVHPSAGAGLWTTANDQLKFYRMLMNLGMGDNGVRILKEETVKNLLATRSREEKLGNYSLGLYANNKGEFGHGGAWGTYCLVNWKNKRLYMKVVQNVGKIPECNKAWNKAAVNFFAAKLDTGAEAYTNRLK